MHRHLGSSQGQAAAAGAASSSSLTHRIEVLLRTIIKPPTKKVKGDHKSSSSTDMEGIFDMTERMVKHVVPTDPRVELAADTLPRLRWGRSALLFGGVLPPSSFAAAGRHYASLLRRVGDQREFDPPSRSETASHWRTFELLEARVEAIIRRQCSNTSKAEGHVDSPSSRVVHESLHQSSGDADHEDKATYCSPSYSPHHFTEVLLADTDLALISPLLPPLLINHLFPLHPHQSLSSPPRVPPSVVKACVIGWARYHHTKQALKWIAAPLPSRGSAADPEGISSTKDAPPQSHALPSFSFASVIHRLIGSHRNGFEAAWLLVKQLPPNVFALPGDASSTSISPYSRPIDILTGALEAAEKQHACAPSAVRRMEPQIWMERVLFGKDGLLANPITSMKVCQTYLVVSSGKKQSGDHFLHTVTAAITEQASTNDVAGGDGSIGIKGLGRLMNFLRHTGQPEAVLLMVAATDLSLVPQANKKPVKWWYQSSYSTCFSAPLAHHHGSVYHQVMMALAEVGKWELAFRLYERLHEMERSNVHTHYSLAKTILNPSRVADGSSWDEAAYPLCITALARSRGQSDDSTDTTENWRKNNGSLEDQLGIWAAHREDYPTVFALFRDLCTKEEQHDALMQHPLYIGLTAIVSAFLSTENCLRNRQQGAARVKFNDTWGMLEKVCGASLVTPEKNGFSFPLTDAHLHLLSAFLVSTSYSLLDCTEDGSQSDALNSVDQFFETTGNLLLQVWQSKMSKIGTQQEFDRFIDGFLEYFLTLRATEKASPSPCSYRLAPPAVNEKLLYLLALMKKLPMKSEEKAWGIIQCLFERMLSAAGAEKKFHCSRVASRIVSSGRSAILALPFFPA